MTDHTPSTEEREKLLKRIEGVRERYAKKVDSLNWQSIPYQQKANERFLSDVEYIILESVIEKTRPSLVDEDMPEMPQDSRGFAEWQAEVHDIQQRNDVKASLRKALGINLDQEREDGN